MNRMLTCHADHGDGLGAIPETRDAFGIGAFVQAGQRQAVGVE
ncbi:MAG: hypothetical protein WDO24_03265 [Pseudomonadota bacterium]